jgi:hypothetical protein
MKSHLPGTASSRELIAPTLCSSRRGRGCFNADGRQKQLYLTRAAAKKAAKKYQNVYPCASGDGFHIGSTHLPPK